MKLIMGVALAAIVVACSSSDDGSALTNCEYVGTYSMTANLTSSACAADDPDAGVTGQSSEPHPVTVTVSGPDSTGSVYAVQLEGVQGGCRGEVLAGCKLQTKCEITLTDALDPANRVGTYQFSWTFTHAGYSGSETLNLPPAQNYSHGCRGEADVTATRK